MTSPGFVRIFWFHSMSHLKFSFKIKWTKEPAGKPAFISNGTGPLLPVSDKVNSLGSCVASISDITASDPSVVVVIGSSMVVYMLIP